jgi:hypothetical protein
VNAAPAASSRGALGAEIRGEGEIDEVGQAVDQWSGFVEEGAAELGDDAAQGESSVESGRLWIWPARCPASASLMRCG